MQMADPRLDLGEFVYRKNYARFLPPLSRREFYPESMNRVMNMHRKKYGPMLEDAEYQEIEDWLTARQGLPSQRTTQFAGPAIERINMRAFNCTFSPFDRIEFLKEAVWLLLCGCGVGFSVQREHIAKLPRLKQLSKERTTHVVGDSIEGWADAMHALLMSYVDGSARVSFDYSEVRPEGAFLSTSSSKAPGPKPLRDSIEAMRLHLDKIVNRRWKRRGIIRDIDAYDLLMFAVTCVRAGGIRRSATICLFSPDSVAMRKAKSAQDWFDKNPQRQYSNNSNAFVRSETTFEQFLEAMQECKAYGEPGTVFLQAAHHGVNPCVEAAFDPWSELFKAFGWSFCNLTSINVATCQTPEDFYRSCRIAAVLGTLQAGYQDMGYLGNDSASADIMRRDALLGVSLTGMANNPRIAFDPEVLRRGAKIVVDTNKEMAKRIGINAAARTTLVKPEGTGSLVLMVESGIAPAHGRCYLKYIDGGKITDPLVQHFLKYMPMAVVPKYKQPDEVKLVFPIELTGEVALKSEISGVKHLELIKTVQENWVQPGTVRGDLCHNVSNTVNVKQNEWDEVFQYIWDQRDCFTGISLLGDNGDLQYTQPPFLAILEDDEIQARYGDDKVLFHKAHEAKQLWQTLRNNWVPVDWTTLVETEDMAGGTEMAACAAGGCVV